MADKAGDTPADDTPAAAPQDDIAALNEKAKRFGPAYAIFSEGFSSPGVDRLVGAVKIGIAAFAVFVVGSAIWSAL